MERASARWKVLLADGGTVEIFSVGSIIRYILDLTFVIDVLIMKL